MKRYAIPGMAIGLTMNGRTYVFDYGVASRQTRKPVTRSTLFELGSTSKTLTATLASYAQQLGKLSLAENVGTHVPSLRGSRFGAVSLVNLGTHTAGGLPLQVPEDVATYAQLLAYLRRWRPAHPAGTYRTYSNISAGMLGAIAAAALHRPFVALMQDGLLPALGMRHTYIEVPRSAISDYAQGYTENGRPIRMAPGVLSAEAYGIKSTAADMIRFVEANMQMVRLSPDLRRALSETQTGYFRDGPMTQDLIWEQYVYPVSLQTLLAGNSDAMIFSPTPVTGILPPEPPGRDVWIDKTGSTNGFGAYVAFEPRRRFGIVILANKEYPIPDRVRIAYRIFKRLER